MGKALLLFGSTNKMKINALLFIFIWGSICSLSAQNLKFGHINSTELLSKMPDVKTADGELQTYSKQLEGQLKAMTEEYQTKVQDFQSKQTLLADAVKEAKVKEITDLELRIQEFQMTAQESLEKKKETLYSPILKKAETAIKEIAKEQGYAYVFDTSTGSGILYAPDSDNIMDKVKKKLGLL